VADREYDAPTTKPNRLARQEPKAHQHVISKPMGLAKWEREPTRKERTRYRALVSKKAARKSLAVFKSETFGHSPLEDARQGHGWFNCESCNKAYFARKNKQVSEGAPRGMCTSCASHPRRIVGNDWQTMRGARPDFSANHRVREEHVADVPLDETKHVVARPTKGYLLNSMVAFKGGRMEKSDADGVLCEHPDCDRNGPREYEVTGPQDREKMQVCRDCAATIRHASNIPALRDYVKIRKLN
jgi:hypothetical protein